MPSVKVRPLQVCWQAAGRELQILWMTLQVTLEADMQEGFDYDMSPGTKREKILNPNLLRISYLTPHNIEGSG